MNRVFDKPVWHRVTDYETLYIIWTLQIAGVVLDTMMDKETLSTGMRC